MSALADDERRARLRLARTHGIGAVGYRELLASHGSASAACRALLGEGKALVDERIVERECAAVARLGARHLLAGEDSYPPLLAALADPPPVLVALGDPALVARPVVAIVGARNASAAGRHLAEELARALSEAGFVVASGLARGIDGAAHRGALARGTIGCVAGGVDIAYPPEHAALQRDIAGQGLLLSEVPPGTEPQARHFPRRNRLIAGIARGVVVLEAAPGSGSLITARLAGEFGREVMAVPGHPADPRSRGGNRLIRDGAALVETADDVLSVLSPFAVFDAAPRPATARKAGVRRAAPPVPSRPAPTGEDPAALDSALWSLLTVEGVPVDDLVRLSGRAAGDVQARLVDFELDGRILRLPGGRIARRR